MNTIDNDYETKKVEELLTPKFTPECKVKFTVEHRRRIKPCILRYARIGGVAAACVLAVAIGIKGLLVEEVKAMPSPVAMVERALQEFGNLQSICVKFKLKNPLSDYGYPTGAHELTDGYTCGTLYYLKQNEKNYMRIEWDDESNTTHISDGENETLMQGGVSLGEISSKKARPLPDIIKFTDKKSIMEIVPEQIHAMTVFNSTGQIIMELRIPDKKGEFVLTFASIPKQGEAGTIDVDNENQDLRLTKASMITGSGETEEIILETDAIEYNYPITKEQIFSTVRLQ